MPIRMQITGLTQLRRTFAANLTPYFLQDASLEVAKLVKEEVSQYPGPSRQPVLWKSERQRRYYYMMRRKLTPLSANRATKTLVRVAGRGSNRRTWLAYSNALPPSYLKYNRQVDPTSQWLGGSWTLGRYGRSGAKVTAEAGYASYVVGDNQQIQHKWTGWPSARAVAIRVGASAYTRQVFERAVYRALTGRPGFAGVPRIGSRVI